MKMELSPEHRELLAQVLNKVRPLAQGNYAEDLDRWIKRLMEGQDPVTYGDLVTRETEEGELATVGELLQLILKPHGVLIQIQHSGEFVAAPVVLWLVTKEDGEELETALLTKDLGTYTRSTSQHDRKLAWVYLPGSEAIMKNTIQMIQEGKWMARQMQKFLRQMPALFKARGLPMLDGLVDLVGEAGKIVAELSKAGAQELEIAIRSHQARVTTEERTHLVQEVFEEYLKWLGMKGDYQRVKRGTRKNEAPLAKLLAQLFEGKEEISSQEKALKKAKLKMGNFIEELEAILARWAEEDETNLVSADFLAHFRVIEPNVAASTAPPRPER
jgi:hypothetical protein